MTPHSTKRRVLLTLLAAVQLALPAAVAVADIRPASPPDSGLAAAAGAPVAQRPRAHPDDCVFCRFLAHAYAPLAIPARLPPTAEAACDATPEQLRCPPRIARALQRARSPPLYS